MLDAGFWMLDGFGASSPRPRSSSEPDWASGEDEVPFAWNWESSSGTWNQSSRAQSTGQQPARLTQGIRRWIAESRRSRLSGEAADSRVKRAARKRSGRAEDDRTAARERK